MSPELWTGIGSILALVFGLILKKVQAQNPAFKDKYLIPAIYVLTWLLNLLKDNIPPVAPTTGEPLAMAAVFALSLPNWMAPFVAALKQTALAVLYHRLYKDTAKER